MRRLISACAVILMIAGLSGCATTDGGLARSLQGMVKELVTEPLTALKADANARLITIDAQVAAGRMTPIAAAQKKQCATNVIAFVDGVQAQIGMEIPDGAGAIWLLGILNDMQGEQLNVMKTQIELAFETCQAQVRIGIF